MEPNAAIKIGEIRHGSLSIEVGKNALQAAMYNPRYAAMIAHDDLASERHEPESTSNF